jgi:hypothetical protein
VSEGCRRWAIQTTRRGRVALAILLAGLVAVIASGASAAPPGVTQVNQPGFSSDGNSYAWSMQWFNGKLYVGTGRHVLCVERATQDFYFPARNRYVVHPDPDVTCPADKYDLDLRAEIWRYDPSAPPNTAWKRLFQSEVVPNPQAPGKLMARDTAFRGMTVFALNGKPQLYVGGVSAREWIPGLPAPRILRMRDDETFEQVGGDPGQIRIGWDPKPIWDPTSFRAMVSYQGKLFVSLAPSLTGDGVIMEYDPATDSLRQISDPNLRVFELNTFNDYLYAGTGDDARGYGVSKSKMTGPAPYAFTPVVANGAGRGRTITSVVSMHAFKGRLYVGSSGWNTLLPSSELIRVNPDDSWQLVVGSPRPTAQGFKFPISGFGDSFGNIFNAHFWRMNDHQSTLALGTNDFSWLLRTVPILDPLIRHEYGFDLFTSTDGWHWSRMTRDGFGQKFDFGARTLASSPEREFLGTANHVEGTRVWGLAALIAPSVAPPPSARSEPETRIQPSAQPPALPSVRPQPNGPAGAGSPSPVPSAGAEAAAPGACSPRPAVQMSTAQTPQGDLQVAIAAGRSGALPNNQIQEVQVRAGDDALVDVPGQAPGATGTFSIRPQPGTQQVTFTVRRAQPGRPLTVPLSVVDACGPWTTLVGMGANAGTPTPPGGSGPLSSPIQVDVEAQGGVNIVSWDVPPGATRFQIFRSEYQPNPAPGVGPPNLDPLPAHQGVGIPNEPVAGGLPPDALLLGSFAQVGVSDTFYYQDRNVRQGAQYQYFVVAEGQGGNVSDPSNLALAPSQAPPVTADVLQGTVADLVGRGKLGRDQADAIMRTVAGARDASQRGDPAGARTAATSLRDQLARGQQELDPLDAEDLQILAAKLERRLRLGEARVLTP